MSDLTNRILPGDVINLQGQESWKLKTLFLDIGKAIVIPIIVDTQKRVFGKNSRYKDNHTMLYLGEGKVFSCHPPRPEIIDLREFDEADKSRIVTLYRMNKSYFGRELRLADMPIMRKGAEIIVAGKQEYDTLQNLMILFNQMTGYPWSYKLTWLDSDKHPADDFVRKQQHFVCSVSVAAIIAYWRHEVYKVTGEDIPQPWKFLKRGAWAQKQLESYPSHWDINATYPANFATTDTNFQNEFIRVGRFKAGKLLA